MESINRIVLPLKVSLSRFPATITRAVQLEELLKEPKGRLTVNLLQESPGTYLQAQEAYYEPRVKANGTFQRCSHRPAENILLRSLGHL
jgi:hypothetical protein